MLGANLYPGHDIDGLPAESPSLKTRTILHRRELFWVCYAMDMEITFRTGRPPCLNDTSCDLTFPVNYLKQISPGYTGRWRLPGDLRLSIIKSKAYEKLYSPHSLQKSDAEILKDIRELDDLLENWRLSLPTAFRPSLSSLEGLGKELDSSHMEVPVLLIQLEYYHCMTTIHQASSRCTNWAHNHRIVDGLRSSIELALQASRSMLSYLHSEVSVSYLKPNLFWYVRNSTERLYNLGFPSIYAMDCVNSSSLPLPPVLAMFLGL